jgi:hypothetical protein
MDSCHFVDDDQFWQQSLQRSLKQHKQPGTAKLSLQGKRKNKPSTKAKQAFD